MVMALFLVAGPSWAAEEHADTTYGRIEGDLAVVAGVGAAVGARGPRGAADLRLRYLDTVGVWGTYEDGVMLGSASEPRRVLSTGVELRPLFLARWLQGAELGLGRVDLAIDSLGLEIGAFFAQPQGGAFGQRPGLQLGLGLELPVLARASGPWIGLHGGVRWSDHALDGADAPGPADRALFLAVTLSWHQLFGGHVVDVGDKAPR